MKKTCRDSGNSTIERGDEIYEYAFDECPHEDVDRRGSSRTTSEPFANSVGVSSTRSPWKPGSIVLQLHPELN